jgi:hypothetical protein
MTEEEFQAFLAESVPEYAAEKVKAGNWTPEEALEKSRKEHTRLLPEGLPNTSRPPSPSLRFEDDIANRWQFRSCNVHFVYLGAVGQKEFEFP